ncbi:tetratricopeptide repeat protein [bacterium]|nr:MAG: tetratricopeptide repeat protein [bacterium]
MKKAGFLAVIVLLVFTGMAFSAKSQTDDERYSRSVYKDAMTALRSGDPYAAIPLFFAADKADPSSILPVLGIGRANQAIFEKTMRNYSAANEAYTKVIERILVSKPESLAPEVFDVYLYQGFLLLKGGEYLKAIASLEKYKDIRPEYEKMAEVLNAIGIAYYYMGEYDRAVVYFKKALDSDGAFSEARFNLRSVFTRITGYNEAQVLHRSGDRQKALGRIEKLKEIAPRYLPGRELEARLLAELGKTGEAIRVYDEILGFYPDNPKTYWIRIEMARVLIALGDKDRARMVLMDNLARFPEQEDQRARMELVNLLVKLGGSQ